MTRDEKGWCTSQLREALKRQKITPVCLHYPQLIGRINYTPEASAEAVDILQELDAMITRPISRGTLEQILFRMNLLHKLERSGMLIINPPQAIERAVDKYCSLTIFQENKIPVPRTAVTASYNEALKCFEELEGDIVVKPLFGSRGVGATRITDPEIAARVFRTISFYHGIIYMQEFIPHGDSDIRAFVIGDRVVAAMRRVADDWKNNFSSGAKPVPTKLSEELKNLAINAADVLGCKVAGVDIIEGPNGPVVLEVNSQPGWRGLQSVTETNIADEIVSYVLSELGRKNV
jgi:RimK family alpha-L-glutamate ligase